MPIKIVALIPLIPINADLFLSMPIKKSLHWSEINRGIACIDRGSPVVKLDHVFNPCTESRWNVHLIDISLHFIEIYWNLRFPWLLVYCNHPPSLKVELMHNQPLFCSIIEFLSMLSRLPLCTAQLNCVTISTLGSSIERGSLFIIKQPKLLYFGLRFEQ